MSTKANSKVKARKQISRTAKPSEKLTYEEKKELKLRAQREKEKQKAKRGEPANKDKFYCTNKELQAELIRWRDSAKKLEDRTMSDELGRMLMAIGDKVLNRSEFRNYTKELKEDMRSFFFYKSIRGLKNYDFAFNNPFAWLTQCAFNAYITILKKHYKQINIKKDLMKKLLSEMETYPGMNAASSLSKCIKTYIDENADD